MLSRLLRTPLVKGALKLTMTSSQKLTTCSQKLKVTLFQRALSKRSIATICGKPVVEPLRNHNTTPFERNVEDLHSRNITPSQETPLLLLLQKHSDKQTDRKEDKEKDRKDQKEDKENEDKPKRWISASAALLGLTVGIGGASAYAAAGDESQHLKEQANAFMDYDVLIKTLQPFYYNYLRDLDGPSLGTSPEEFIKTPEGKILHDRATARLRQALLDAKLPCISYDGKVDLGWQTLANHFTMPTGPNHISRWCHSQNRFLHRFDVFFHKLSQGNDMVTPAQLKQTPVMMIDAEAFSRSLINAPAFQIGILYGLMDTGEVLYVDAFTLKMPKCARFDVDTMAASPPTTNRKSPATRDSGKFLSLLIENVDNALEYARQYYKDRESYSFSFRNNSGLKRNNSVLKRNHGVLSQNEHLDLDCRESTESGITCLYSWSISCGLDDDEILELFQIIKRGGGVTLELALVQRRCAENALTMACKGIGASKWVRHLLSEPCLDRGWSKITTAGHLPLCRILEYGSDDEEERSATDQVATRIATLTDDTAINHCDFLTGESPFFLATWNSFFGTLRHLASRPTLNLCPEHKSHWTSTGELVQNPSIHAMIVSHPKRYIDAAHLLADVFADTRQSQATLLDQCFSTFGLLVPLPVCNLIASYSTHSILLSLDPLKRCT